MGWTDWSHEEVKRNQAKK
jgi:NAD-dependent DNA ligase